MRIGFATLVTTLAAIPMVAYAEPMPRMTDVQYIRAAKCVALSEAPQINADVAWLKAEVKTQARGREGYIVSKAKTEARDAERAAKRAESDVALATLKAAREAACQGFSQV